MNAPPIVASIYREKRCIHYASKYSIRKTLIVRGLKVYCVTNRVSNAIRELFEVSNIHTPLKTAVTCMQWCHSQTFSINLVDRAKSSGPSFASLVLTMPRLNVLSQKENVFVKACEHILTCELHVTRDHSVAFPVRNVWYCSWQRVAVRVKVMPTVRHSYVRGLC